MSSFITLLCIFGICVFMYSYISMYNLNKDYPTKCNVIYLPRTNDINRESSPHMEVLDHEAHDSQFRHTRFSTAPMGRSEIDNLLSSNMV